MAIPLSTSGSTRRTTLWLVALFIALTGALLMAQPTEGAKIYVGCAASDLINAITAGNAGSPASLQLTAGCTYTLTGVNNVGTSGSNGLPVITGDIAIGGYNAQIVRSGAPGTPDFRIFEVAPTGKLHLDSVTLRNGRALRGGAIRNSGALTISNSDFSANSAINEAGAIYHGGSGPLNVTNSRFTDNTAMSTVGVGGGALFVGPSTIVTVTASVFSGNNAAFAGGAVGNYGGTLTVVNSTFSGNHSDKDGAAIYNAGTGTLSVMGTTFSGNTASNSGGGIYDEQGVVNVTNSTFWNNTVNNSSGTDGGGGAISAHTGTYTVTNSSLVYNHAAAKGGSLYSYTEVTLRNTLVAHSTPTNCFGGIANLGGNLSFPDTSCPGLNADPKTGPLANNGGLTWTIALGPGSAAIDRGVNVFCPPTDQRGVARPQDGDKNGSVICDIGAFEVPGFGIFLPAIFR